MTIITAGHDATVELDLQPVEKIFEMSEGGLLETLDNASRNVTWCHEPF